MRTARSPRGMATAALVGTAAAASIALPCAAGAQIIDRSAIMFPARPARPSTVRSAFARDGNVGVLDRLPAAFAAHGVAIGGLDFFPGLTIATEGISNVYANNANRHGDIALLISPEGELRTRGGPIDLSLYGRGRLTRLARYGSDNTNEVIGGIEASAGVGPRADLSAGASYAHRILPRYASDSPIDAARPLRFDELDARLGGAIEGGRTRIVGRGDLTQLRFANGRRFDGGTIDAKDRDRTIVSGLLRVERALKSNLSVYVAGTGNVIDYRLAPPRAALQRDSKGWGAYVGTSFDLRRVVRGDVRVGYIRQTFDPPGVKSVSGLGLKGSVQYFPTRLTDITLRAERAIQDSGVPGTAGFVHTGAEVEINHELRRYIMAAVTLGHAQDEYRGLARRDRNTYAAITGTYLSRSHWNAKLGYQYNRRHSDSSTSANFDDHRLLAGLTLQY